jgi:hypothetical protein
LLAEDIRDLRESNHRIAARVDSLEVAVRDLGRDLGNFRADVAAEIGGLRSQVATEIGGLRSEVVERLGAINTNLERFQARTETALRIAGWALTILVPLVISLVGAGFWITWHAAKLDSRIERVESRLGKEPGAPPTARVP